MKKIPLLLLSLLLLSACTLNQGDLAIESQELNSPEDDISVQDKTLDQKELECASIGESPSNFDFSSGQEIEGGKDCCPGLKSVGFCNCIGSGICSRSIGGPGICTPCGDGVCDEEYENSCNCPEDCLSKI